MTSEYKEKEFSTLHLEETADDQPQRRRSSVAAIDHTETPVWEVRKTYTKQGKKIT